MPAYVVMFPADDEAEWQTRTEAERQTTFDTDYEFGQALKARGGAITGGAALTVSSEARTLRRGQGSQPVVTTGPYRESTEQLAGFFLVTCDEYDVLVDVAQILTRAHPVVEIRPVQEF